VRGKPRLFFVGASFVLSFDRYDISIRCCPRSCDEFEVRPIPPDLWHWFRRPSRPEQPAGSEASSSYSAATPRGERPHSGLASQALDGSLRSCSREDYDHSEYCVQAQRGICGCRCSESVAVQTATIPGPRGDFGGPALRMRVQIQPVDAHGLPSLGPMALEMLDFNRAGMIDVGEMIRLRRIDHSRAPSGASAPEG